MSNRFDRTWSLEPFLHYHLDSALFFSKRAAELEREFYWGSPAREILTDEKMLTKNQRISTRWDKQLLTKEEQILEVTLLKEHLAYVIGSIFASVAFLEATINEVFLEANRGADESVRDGLLEKLPRNAIDSMGQLWSDKFERRPILNKYRRALDFASNPLQLEPFNKYSRVWREVDLLIRLRNSLTHHKSELIEYRLSDSSYKAETGKTASLMKELKVRGFRNKLYHRGSALNLSAAIEALPTTLLGANCAVWAIRQSLKFACEFCRRMPIEGLKNVIDSRLEELEKPVYTFD